MPLMFNDDYNTLQAIYHSPKFKNAKEQIIKDCQNRGVGLKESYIDMDTLNKDAKGLGNIFKDAVNRVLRRFFNPKLEDSHSRHKRIIAKQKIKDKILSLYKQYKQLDNYPEKKDAIRFETYQKAIIYKLFLDKDYPFNTDCFIVHNSIFPKDEPIIADGFFIQLFEHTSIEDLVKAWQQIKKQKRFFFNNVGKIQYRGNRIDNVNFDLRDKRGKEKTDFLTYFNLYMLGRTRIKEGKKNTYRKIKSDSRYVDIIDRVNHGVDIGESEYRRGIEYMTSLLMDIDLD